MGQSGSNIVIEKEIQRLSLRIAIARDSLYDVILGKLPSCLRGELCQEISICLLQRSALRNDKYDDLPYNIKLLYREVKPNKDKRILKIK